MCNLLRRAVGTRSHNGARDDAPKESLAFTGNWIAPANSVPTSGCASGRLAYALSRSPPFAGLYKILHCVDEYFIRSTVRLELRRVFRIGGKRQKKKEFHVDRQTWSLGEFSLEGERPRKRHAPARDFPAEPLLISKWIFLRDPFLDVSSFVFFCFFGFFPCPNVLIVCSISRFFGSLALFVKFFKREQEFLLSRQLCGKF